jgi:NAD(P)-dependent dehydrogenase (short-subunit alcohol dehydrogenase family)
VEGVDGRGGQGETQSVTRTFGGKSVVVTGAARGIGAAIARRFARENARLALLDRDLGGVEKRAEEIAATGAQVFAARCDVTSIEDCHAAIRAAYDAYGGVDVLVNNAGITHLSRFRDTEVDVIRRVLEVNFFGAVNCTKAALEPLLARRGQIIVLSSVAGFAPLAKRTAYSASKFALHGFFETLRSEHRGDGLGVLLVCPYYVKTDIGRVALGGDGRPAGDPRRDARGLGDPDDVAGSIVDAARRDRRLLLIGPQARLSWLLARFAPSLYERLMLRRVFGT